MPHFAGVRRWHRQLLRVAAAVAHAKQAAARRRGKDDVAVRHPYRPKRLRGFRQRHRQTTRERHLAQLSPGEKTDPAPVGGKERPTCVVCARYPARIELVEGPDVQPAHRVASTPRENRTLRRERQRGRPAIECCTRRGLDAHPNNRRNRRGKMRVLPKGRDRQRPAQHGNSPRNQLTAN